MHFWPIGDEMKTMSQNMPNQIDAPLIEYKRPSTTR